MRWRVFGFGVTLILIHAFIYSEGSAHSNSKPTLTITNALKDKAANCAANRYGSMISPGLCLKAYPTGGSNSGFYRDGGSSSLYEITEFKNTFAQCKLNLKFQDVLKYVEDSSNTTGEIITIHPVRSRYVPLFHLIELTRFQIDMDDLQTFPLPLKESSGKWVFEKGVPAWAETQCSFLAHELAEAASLAAKKHQLTASGRQFSRNAHYVDSHCNVANPASDRVAQEYSGLARQRKREYFLTDANHTDVVIEIRPHGYVFLHGSRPFVRYTNNGPRHWPWGRISNVTFGDKLPSGVRTSYCH